MFVFRSCINAVNFCFTFCLLNPKKKENLVISNILNIKQKMMVPNYKFLLEKTSFIIFFTILIYLHYKNHYEDYFVRLP